MRTQNVQRKSPVQLTLIIGEGWKQEQQILFSTWNNLSYSKCLVPLNWSHCCTDSLRVSQERIPGHLSSDSYTPFWHSLWRCSSVQVCHYIKPNFPSIVLPKGTIHIYLSLTGFTVCASGSQWALAEVHQSIHKMSCSAGTVLHTRVGGARIHPPCRKIREILLNHGKSHTSNYTEFHHVYSKPCNFKHYSSEFLSWVHVKKNLHWFVWFVGEDLFTLPISHWAERRWRLEPENHQLAIHVNWKDHDVEVQPNFFQALKTKKNRR